MEAYQQLDLIEKFGSMDVRIRGTKEEPLFSANDIIINVLGYHKHTHCKPWKRISQLPKYAFQYDESTLGLSQGQHKKQWFLTERGLFELLCQSRQEVAENFKDWVFALLKSWRNGEIQMIKYQSEQTQKQLEEARKEIEELKQPKVASIYVFKHGDRILYVGKDKSKAQNRPQQHLTERRKIAQNHQLIDIFLASIPENEIKIEIHPCNDQEADKLEQEYIQDLEPEYNQSMNNKEYECSHCDPPKPYKNRGSYEKHLIQFHLI